MTHKDVGALSDLAQHWPDGVPETERLIFVTLPPERQRVALRRLEAMRDFQNGEASPKVLMQRLNLGRTQFYKLVGDWGANRSLTSLVPHSKPSKPRTPRVKPAVLELCRQVLLEQAGQPAEDVSSETNIMREIQARAGERELPVPADSSVRRAIARLALEDPELQLSAVSRGQKSVGVKAQSGAGAGSELLEFTQVFGGRLLVDHSTLDLIVSDGNRTFRPTISLVVDDATRVVLGSQLFDRIPGLNDFLNVLAFAANGYGRLRGKGISAVHGLHPVLTMRGGLSKQWRSFYALAEQSRFKGGFRKAPEPVFGHLLRRSMITKIGSLRLLPRSTMLDPTDRIHSNDAGRPVVPWADALTLLDAAILQHNSERLKATPDEVLTGSGRGANLRLNTERRDWLEFGLGVFRDAWASEL